MGQYEKEIREIRNGTTTRSLLEQLAEEAAELSQAALKYIRAAGLAEDNPTPRTAAEAIDGLVEEFGDVCLVAYILGIGRTVPTDNKKAQRWAERLAEASEKGNT